MFLYVMFRGSARDGATVFETHVKHRFELDLKHSDARLDRLSGELQCLMGSRPILIHFPGEIMMQNPFFTPDISSTWSLCDYFLWAQQGELIQKIFAGMVED